MVTRIRHFSRGGQPQGGRRFRGHYVRSRHSPNHHLDHPDDEQYGQHQSQSSLNQYNQLHSGQLQQDNHHQPREQQQPSRILNRNSSSHDIEDIKEICLKLASELHIVKSCISEITSNLEQLCLQQQRHQTTQNNSAPTATTTSTATDNNGKRRKTKLLRRRNKSERDQPNSLNEGDPAGGDERNPERRRRNQKQDIKDKPLPLGPNDDSTTQAADPSSEDKIEGENGERVKRVIRRRKQNPYRRGYNRRNRMDSSERNSNDTSPQNEVDDEDYRRPQKPKNAPKHNYPDLTDDEIHDITDDMCGYFFSSDLEAVDKAIVKNSPNVVKIFASALLEHVICDVSSTDDTLTEIANNLSQTVIGIEGGRKFERAFYAALTDLSKREKDIAIDAPRYMDTLGVVLAQSLIPLNTGRNRTLMRAFLRQSVFAYGKKKGHKLFASILRALASSKSERYAAQIYEYSNLYFNSKFWNDEFLESQDIKFINKQFSPEPPEIRRAPAEMEKFADDITDLVENKCSVAKIIGKVEDLELEPEEKTDYLGTLVYAIVRGCLVTDSGEYKLDTEALNKYSALLKNQDRKKEQQDAIALHALTALTKLWHSYNCPQNLMSNILLALHGHGGASYDALQTWLNSDDLKNIPGIGAARLNSKRCIEDLGAARS